MNENGQFNFDIDTFYSTLDEVGDPYKVLGLPKTATPDEIQKTYRALVKKSHTDVNDSKQAEKQIRKINAAYELLKKDDKRELVNAVFGTTFIASSRGRHQESPPPQPKKEPSISTREASPAPLKPETAKPWTPDVKTATAQTEKVTSLPKPVIDDDEDDDPHIDPSKPGRDRYGRPLPIATRIVTPSTPVEKPTVAPQTEPDDNGDNDPHVDSSMPRADRYGRPLPLRPRG
jgi:hypothetical protein